jgi:hypothetical protein
MTIVRAAGVRAIGERRDRVTQARVVRVRAKGRARTVRWAERGIGITGVWRDTLAAFCDHAPSILLLAFAGFAAPAIICIFLSVVLRFDLYGQASGPFATWSGIGVLRGESINLSSVLVILQAGLGAIGLAFARGAIASLALGGADAKDARGLAVACRTAWARLPGLLIGSLVYGAIVMLGAVGINAALHDTDFDLSFVGQQTISLPGHAQLLGLRALDALTPSPGSPFAEFVPLLRHTAFQPFIQLTPYEQQLVEQYGAASVIAGSRSASLQWITFASVVLLILAEALLRFSPIIAMRLGEQDRLRAIAPVWHSLCFGLRHFGAVTIHVWLLRLLFVAAYSIFFMLPVVLMQDAAPPIVRSVTSVLAGHWSLTLTLVCYWLVMALFMAFSTVYGARLVLALAEKTNPRHAVFPAAASAPPLVGGCQSASTTPTTTPTPAPAPAPAPAPDQVDAADLIYAVRA